MKKISLIVFLLSLIFTFIYMNKTDQMVSRRFPHRKVITVADNKNLLTDPDSFNHLLEVIAENYETKIFKFTNKEYYEKVYYEINYVKSIDSRSVEVFNKDVIVNESSRKIKNNDIEGVYYFEKYNYEIEQKLNSYGLNIIDYPVSKVKEIAHIFSSLHFFLIIMALGIYIMFSAKELKNKKNKLKEVLPLESKYLVAFTCIFGLTVVLLWFYNRWQLLWSYLLNFSYIYLISMLFLLFSYILSALFQKKFGKKLDYGLINKITLIISRVVLGVLFYAVIVLIMPFVKELWLYNSAPFINKVEDYSVIDISGFLPEYYYGIEDVETNISDFELAKSDVLLAAFNRGYIFSNDNYNPYVGNSLLVSPNYFDRVALYDSDEREIRINSESVESGVELIIPYSQKNKTDDIEQDYIEWASFLTDTPTQKFEVKIRYSKDNQQLYSFGLQNNLQSLVLNDPVVLVINPEWLNSEQVVALMSSRFLLNKESESRQMTEFEKMYFSEINTINYIKKNYLKQLIFEILTIIVVFICIFSCLIFIQKKRLELIDIAIADAIVLLGIALFLPFDKFCFVLMIVTLLFTYSLHFLVPSKTIKK